jgi:hypothetical protein
MMRTSLPNPNTPKPRKQRPVATEATPSKAITVGKSAAGEPLLWN